jgi:hypothetical protein
MTFLEKNEKKEREKHTKTFAGDRSHENRPFFAGVNLTVSEFD